MHKYHYIPIKTKTPWIQDNFVFFFQIGKRVVYEKLIEDNIEGIESLAQHSGLKFIYYKHLIQNKESFNLDSSENLLFKSMISMTEDEYYFEIDWQIFTYQALDSVYLIRKLDENHFIAWGEDAFKNDGKDISFPFECLLPLNDIIIGENCKIPYRETTFEHKPLKTPTTNPELFFKEEYECVGCKHKSIIFISKGYDFYNICNSDSYCSNCKGIKDTICSGDLIFRSDWPECDNDPWQLQCCYINEDLGLCEECKPHFNKDFKDLKPACPKCEGTMVYK